MPNLLAKGSLLLFAAGSILSTMAEDMGKELPERTNEIQGAIDSFAAKLKAGGVSAATVNSNGIRFYAASAPGKEDPVPTPDTVFELGSITKVFTALLLTETVHEGKVSFDSPLSDILTDWPARKTAPAGKITLRELATHHSGLPRLPGNIGTLWMVAHLYNPYETYDQALFYQWFDTVEPGSKERYEYSNAGFGILGHALSVVWGKSYADTMQEQVISKLELKDTGATLTPDQQKRLAQPHRETKPVPAWIHLSPTEGSGAMHSTAQDMAHFLEFAMGLKSSPLDKSFAEATAEHAAVALNQTIGYGFHRRQTKQGLWIWHNGGSGGTCTYLAWNEDKKCGVVLLSNNSQAPDPLGVRILNTLSQGSDSQNSRDDSAKHQN